MIERRLTIAFAATLGLLTAVLPAAADPALGTATGRWAGKGWVKKPGDAAKQIVRCRIASDFEAPRLSIDGKCAASGTNFPVKGYIDETSGRFTGRWYSPTSSAVAPVTGRARGKTVAISFTFPGKEGHKPVSGNLSWEKGSDELVLTSTDGTNELSRIVFER
ncbi:hypothetical protein C8N35_107140 [Breoghania corrubedonensis]|uniref:Protease inhibitor Inh n=1 Tax=Breoghania corrubedonensis TaxID=665038 RepID=A0A2T5V6P9_9HYPH|nr:hypothetical protein [Breoghania corrubedonensis]PTW59427.1 hypothetical protein C8N35_107140 [Breoghania corrubedonensis]